jgi:hypothetical protein
MRSVSSLVVCVLVAVTAVVRDGVAADGSPPRPSAGSTHAVQGPTDPAPDRDSEQAKAVRRERLNDAFTVRPGNPGPREARPAARGRHPAADR